MRRVLIVLAFLGFAASFPQQPTNFVVDEAGKLSAQNKHEMIAVATELAKNGGPEVAVAVVNSISPETIETYAIKLAEYWKVGKKGKDNGVIFVIAVKERKLRIEVGYGLEGVLNDAKAGRILDNSVVPYLKHGDWNKGIREGFNAIVQTVKGAN